jgi:hypothetical protein
VCLLIFPRNAEYCGQFGEASDVAYAAITAIAFERSPPLITSLRRRNKAWRSCLTRAGAPTLAGW